MYRFNFLFIFLLPLVSLPCQAEVSVFVVAGQSNAVGFGGNAVDLPLELQMAQNDIPFWYDIGFGHHRVPDDLHLRPIEGNSNWVTLRPQAEYGARRAFDKANWGWGFTDQHITIGHGPEISLGRILADSLPEDIAILKFAFGGTSLANVSYEIDWNIESDEYHEWMLREVATALTQLESQLGDTGHIAGLFWMQGGSDTLYEERAQAYEQNLLDFVASIRNTWGTDLPIIIGQVNEGLVNCSHPDYPPVLPDNLALVRAAQYSVAAASKYNVLVELDDVPLGIDSAHYYSTELQIMGQRFAEHYIQLVYQQSDFDLDRDVDDNDFLIWLQGFGLYEGEATRSDGDADGDLDVDGSDFLVWQREYGFRSLASASIPEPSAFALSSLLTLTTLALARCRRRWTSVIENLI